MMTGLAIISAKLVDPLGLVICFFVLKLAHSKAWAIPIATFVGAFFVELFTHDMNTYQPSLFWYSVIACAMQAIAIYGLIRLKEKLDKEAQAKADENTT